MSNPAIKYAHTMFSKLYARFKYPQYNQFMEIYKMPQNPKIVIFGSSAATTQFIQNHFTGYNHVDGEVVSKEGDKNSATIIADSILRIGENFADGHVITNYPQNIEQAQKLDQMIEGVNLVINLTGGKDGKLNAEVVNYYNERGSIVDFSLEQSGDVSQKLQDTILANIKI